MYRKLVLVLTGLVVTSSFAANTSQYLNQPMVPVGKPDFVWLYKRPGFFRFSYDNLSMPKNIQHMGLLGLTYYADITPELYAGIGAYGSVTGSQGGLFVFGFGGGVHKEFLPHWWADAGLYLGGGGGRSSLVGGGLIVRPYVGIAYSWRWARLGLHYSYVNFPSGLIHSKQVGLDLDFPFDFYYTSFQDAARCPFVWDDIRLCDNNCIGLQRNDLAVIIQSYWQKRGTRNVLDQVQDGRISLIGAELDHYITNKIFWFVKTSGAYSGIPNGYMDILGGLGYHAPIGLLGLAVVPQFSVGAGGGGNVDTGGGVLIHPQIGLEVPINSNFSGRVSGGYLWAPKGELSAYTGTIYAIYHLDIVNAGNSIATHIANFYKAQGWRVQVFNQTYLHPQRAGWNEQSRINLVGFQIDEFFNPLVYFSFQATSAYSGNHSGGYATGMVGAGAQTPGLFNLPLQLFAQFLIGAAGGGSLALGGGAIIEPSVGLQYAFSPALGMQTSIGQLKALRHNLNTPTFSIGLTVRFGTINRQ